jgi:RNA polymerase sigma-70 factor (ECF subfamily)
MKLVNEPREFKDEEHEKSWLIVVASNYCKDMLKRADRVQSADMPADVIDPSASSSGESDVLRAVLALPETYKDCVYMHYYEGYKTDEIARMTETPPSTVRNRLRDARKLLKTELEGSRNDR